jgi:acyl-CoA thioester hydrolase
VDDSGTEVWRGGVNPWQCDQMGHLNVRFYVAHAMEGLAGVGAMLGMDRAFSPRATSTLVVQEHHIRFLREARAGDALHMTAGVLEIDEKGAVVLQILRHSRSGEVSAVFHTRLLHARASDGEAFAWPKAALARASQAMIQVPPGLGPRSMTPGEAPPPVSAERARRLGLVRYAAGAFGPQECDAFGRVSAHHVMARIGDGAAQAIASARSAVGPVAADGRPIGLAVVEYRLIYFDAPRAGDRYDVRSGLRQAETRRLGWSHWMLDPDTGRPWAMAVGLLVPFDLDARKTMSLPEEAVAMLKGKVVDFVAE